MDTVLQDVRFGIRQLARQPGSSTVAVLTLALGIGVSTAIFSVIDATMLRPLPHPDPEPPRTVGPGPADPARPGRGDHRGDSPLHCPPPADRKGSLPLC